MHRNFEGRPFSTEWLVSFKDPRDLWQEHWFALSLEIANIAILFQILRHAKTRGNEACYVVIAAMVSVICFEMLPMMPQPGYLLWWYHQGLINVLHQRVPSFIITSFAIVHYVAHNLTKDCNLPTTTRSFVTGVLGILMYFPYVWLAPRLLLSLVHLDDPVFKARFLDVPYFQVLILFLLFFHTTQLFLQNHEEIEPQDRNSVNYTWCAILSGSVSAFYTIVEQYLLYLIITLTLKQHAGWCLLAALAITASLAKDELKSLEMKSYSIAGALQPLRSTIFWAAVGLFVFSSTLPLWLKTKDLKSKGIRLELGPCHITHDVSNTSPLEITRRRFICQDDAQHLDFDFHCVNQAALRFGVQNNVINCSCCTLSNWRIDPNNSCLLQICFMRSTRMNDFCRKLCSEIWPGLWTCSSPCQVWGAENPHAYIEYECNIPKVKCGVV
ncbi:uncharacterized protein TNIN_13351 [Trichonephila inaurata madagascariensis]|uniref:DUF7802 domain-containing protein n=1 Tax=Trichonephila inaurata madagascariensis TaxID=2747483 RepID=A0A8X6WMZ7_9ARAC|nr:uncharacterized protein TNIN_13351 [Trichonephila inaurata madagascariensis]